MQDQSIWRNICLRRCHPSCSWIKLVVAICYYCYALNSKQEPTAFPKVDQCACFTLPLWSLSSDLCHKQPGNQCWWMTRNGFFIPVLTEEKVSIISFNIFTLSIWQGQAVPHFTAFTLEQYSTYLTVSNMKEKWKIIKSGENFLFAHNITASFHSSFNCCFNLPGT